MFHFNLLPMARKSNWQRRLPKRQSSKLVFVGGMSTEFEPSKQRALNLPLDNFFLNKARTKDWVKITQIYLDDNTSSYLARLGLKPGIAAEIVSQTESGSVIVRIDRQQIGLGADIARRLIVTLTNKQDNEN